MSYVKAGSDQSMKILFLGILANADMNINGIPEQVGSNIYAFASQVTMLASLNFKSI